MQGIYYDKIHNFERKLNLRHTTLENKLHNRALYICYTQQVKDILAFIQRS